MIISGTFIDEISHDIPHQNWGPKEWDADFGFMKDTGIEKVVLIRCGYKRWLTYPSSVLTQQMHAFEPPVDLVEMFLTLSEKHDMEFYFGLYDSGTYWTHGDYLKEVEINKCVIEEVWKRYSGFPAFAGWYLSQECSRNVGDIIDLYAGIGGYCKSISNGLPVLISPFIDGPKNTDREGNRAGDGITLETHEREWQDIFAGIRGSVDIVAFQDGHVDFRDLEAFLRLNREMAEGNGLECWTNTETFDRDMPIRFLPIKWEKLLLKMRLAESAGIRNAITFEFSHFMSPQSSYLQAGHLYNRYKEYLSQNS